MSAHPPANLKNRCLLRFLASHMTHLSYLLFRLPVLTSRKPQYAKEGIRFNTVAPGVVDTPLHKDNPKDFLCTLSPMGSISDAQEIVDAVVFLAEAHTLPGRCCTSMAART